MNRLQSGGAHGGQLIQGMTRVRPPRNKSQAHPGVSPLTPFAHGSQKFQPLPDPLGQPPYHYDLQNLIPDIAQKAGELGKTVFHVVGDTGGVKNPDYQAAVAATMKGDLNRTDGTAPMFFYHLGDVVYFYGQITEYYDQFYEPYNHYNVPILGIPGNHDGDPINSSQTSLDGWVDYFMTPEPRVNPESHDAPRATMCLPNVYFTLDGPHATIIGMYTNVPEGGSIDSVQQQWLTNEFANAPEDKALVVALHHPIYSFDDHHSGSPRMADVVQHAINDSRRVPNIVLSAHVHNYQRIEKEVGDNSIPFIVAGHGGYYHLHGMNIDEGKGGKHTAKKGKHSGSVTDTDTGAHLISSNHTNHGYMTLTITPDEISGVVSLVEEKHYPADPAFDTFSYSSKPLKLQDNFVVSL
ncbi:MAG: metallophosphoesterase [Acidobacteriaceae bacterium]|nr:metallophosphoesterase [Acidobacteriaceae bacterium]